MVLRIQFWHDCSHNYHSFTTFFYNIKKCYNYKNSSNYRWQLDVGMKLDICIKARDC